MTEFYSQEQNSSTLGHKILINRKVTQVGIFEVCVSTHVSLRMFIMQVLASQLYFRPIGTLNWLFCSYSGQKLHGNEGHVALQSGLSVYFLYCGWVLWQQSIPRLCDTGTVFWTFHNGSPGFFHPHYMMNDAFRFLLCFLFPT